MVYLFSSRMCMHVLLIFMYRYIQELISSLYHALINDIGEIHSSHLPTTSSTTSGKTTSFSTSSLDALHVSITTPSVLRHQSIEEVAGDGGVTDLSYNLTDVLALLPSLNKNSIAADSVSNISSTFTPTPVLRKVKIGFLSKFFGIFEPHGLLLDGVMKYLPRHNYEVYALPIARSDSKPLSPSIADAVEYVVEISSSWEYSKVILGQLGLDVLVFADTMSEPMAHFLAHCRYARIQVCLRYSRLVAFVLLPCCLLIFAIDFRLSPPLNFRLGGVLGQPRDERLAVHGLLHKR